MLIFRSVKLKIGGIALFPFILINSKLSSERQRTLVNHERIHIRQQIELLVIPFYVWYLINYLVNRFKYNSHDKAYRNIIFERAGNIKRNLFPSDLADFAEKPQKIVAVFKI